VIVEDSKSTSSQSLEAALGSYLPKDSRTQKKNLLIIVGGSDKGDSFSHLSSKFNERVRAIVCIGETKEKFIQIAKQENIPYLSTDSLLEGVNWLYSE
jgi:UDP-N-acetylmuramoylalanine-D-glutamate ligase